MIPVEESFSERRKEFSDHPSRDTDLSSPSAIAAFTPTAVFILEIDLFWRVPQDNVTRR